MSTETPESGPFWRGLSPREQLNLFIEDESFCRIIARHLLMYTTHDRLVDTLQHLVEVEQVLGKSTSDLAGRLAELERERAHFLDPNRPGE